MSKKKKMIIGSAAAAVVVIGIVVTLLLVFNKDEAYRVIKVLELDGSAVVERENIGELQAYTGMTLQSGDKVSVASNSMVVLQMDDDKYAYIEENSVLSMVAEGTARDSKTTIQLEKGAITCHVDGKLNGNSSYEVHTQNSVMAVRGTVFRVAFYGEEQLSDDFINDADGVVQVSVYDGEVMVTLKNPDGSMGEGKSIYAGEQAGIGNDSSSSFFLNDVDLEKLPAPESKRQVWEALQAIVNKGEKISASQEELDKILEELNGQTVYKVYYYANGQLFAIQEVNSGQTATQPDLSPSASGRWNIDFSKTIMQDTNVYWEQ